MRRACPQLDWGTRPHRHRLVSHEPCRSLDTPSKEKELARARGRPRRATAGCSFGTRRGSPASDTLGPRRGAMQVSSAARITRTADVRWHATAPTRARPRAGRRSLAGTARTLHLPLRRRTVDERCHARTEGQRWAPTPKDLPHCLHRRCHYDPQAPAPRPLQVRHDGRPAGEGTRLDAYANTAVKRDRSSWHAQPDDPAPEPRPSPLAMQKLKEKK